MSYNFKTIPPFDKEVKQLSKKFPSLPNDLKELKNTLSQNPKSGVPLGNNCFKIRISIKSKGKGKSGGARVITCVKVVRETVFLLSIYDKSEKENITDTDLESLLKFID